MTGLRSAEDVAGLVRELRKLPDETGWAEFKVSYAEPRKIGEYISALSNSAALEGKAFAYLAWGIADGNHEVVGTEFRPAAAKVGTRSLRTGCFGCLSRRSTSGSLRPNSTLSGSY